MTNVNIYTEEERKAHVEGWKKSGLTQIEYSNLNGLKKTTLCTWIKRAREQKEKSLVLIKKKSPVDSHNISMEYMGAKLTISKESAEWVFRALKAVNG